MRTLTVSVILIAGVGLPFPSTADAAQAKKAPAAVALTVCNRSQSKASVAVMARDITSGQTEIHGWAGVAPAQCATVASFLPGAFSVYAYSANGARWEGANAACVPRAAFSGAPKTECAPDEDSVKFLGLASTGADYTWTLNGPQNQSATVATLGAPVKEPDAATPAAAATPMAPSPAPINAPEITGLAPKAAPTVAVEAASLPAALVPSMASASAAVIAPASPAPETAAPTPPAPEKLAADAVPQAPLQPRLDASYFNGKEIKFLVTPDTTRGWDFYTLVAQYVQKYLPGAHVAATTAGGAAENIAALYKAAPDSITLVMEPLTAMNDPAISRAVPDFSTFNLNIIGFNGTEPDQAMAFGPPTLSSALAEPLKQAWSSAMADPQFHSAQAMLLSPAPAAEPQVANLAPAPAQPASTPPQQTAAAPPSTPASEPQSPLLAAVDEHDLKAVEALLAQGADPNSADSAKLTALNWAAHYGDLDIVRALMMKGAAVNISANQEGWPPLINAAANGHGDTVEYLLAHGAEIDLSDTAGWTALGYAMDNNHEDVVKILQASGAKTPLDLGKARGYVKDIVGMIWDGKRDDFKSVMGMAASAPHAGLGGGQVGAWYVNAPPFFPGSACEIDYTANGHFLRCQSAVPDKDTGARLMQIVLDATKEKIPSGWKIEADPMSYAAVNPANENEDASVALNYDDGQAMYAVDWSIGSPSSSGLK